MNRVKSILLAGGASFALTAGAGAADLPTKKDQSPPPPNCFATFWTWLDSTPKDCPLSAYGVTVYGSLSAGGGWAAHTAPINGNSTQSVPYLIQKYSRGPGWQVTPGALGADNIGIKIREQFDPGWAFIGDVNYQFDVMDATGLNGPKSLIQNNSLFLYQQSNNSSSAIAGAFDNSRGYFGIDSPYGTLTAGRQTTFTLDATGAYDPLINSYAFSVIGYSSTYTRGMGITETSRYNTSIKYVINYPVAAKANFRVGALGQIGDYSQYNASTGAVQVDVGGDYGGFSGDVIYAYTQNTFTLSNYTFTTSTSVPVGYNPDENLKATLANVSGVLVAGKYSWDIVTLYTGYAYYVYSNPSNDYPGGLQDVLGTGYSVLPGQVTSNAYDKDKIQQIGWVGAKVAVRPDLDVIGGAYVVDQNNYYSKAANSGKAENCGPNTTVTIGPEKYHLRGAANSYCQGDLYAVSGMIDWRPWKRVDVFAGLMYSVASGGIASGYLNTWNVDPTAGIRISF
jgi:hypothetical protein